MGTGEGPARSRSATSALWIVCFLGIFLASGSSGLSVAPSSSEDVRAPAPPPGAHEAIERRLDKILTRSVLKGAEVAAEVRSLTQGEVVYRRGADTPLIPASNQKLLSIALGLCVLGDSFHFETTMSTPGAVDADGTLHAPLWIEGGGDPTLSRRFLDSDSPNAPLRPFVDGLCLREIRRVEGDLIVDDSLFDDEWLGPNWPAKQENRDYCAPVAGLSLNGNCLEVTVRSASPRPHVELAPRSARYRADNAVELSRKAQEMLVALARPDSRGTVRVSGRVGQHAGHQSFPVPVVDAPMFFGASLEHALEEAGIVVTGSVRRPTEAERLQSREGWRELYRHRSPLLNALRVCGKESNNHIADHVLKRAGAKIEGLGSFASGGRALTRLLAEAGVDVDALVVCDGSGLSRDNRVSARLMVDLLAYMYRGPHRDEFLRTLPISGVDGTLDDRMLDQDMPYRVRAKTGYLREVSALSGFVYAGPKDGRGEVYVFSLLFNGFRVSNAEMKKVQNDVCLALVDEHS